MSVCMAVHTIMLIHMGIFAVDHDSGTLEILHRRTCLSNHLSVEVVLGSFGFPGWQPYNMHGVWCEQTGVYISSRSHTDCH